MARALVESPDQQAAIVKACVDIAKTDKLADADLDAFNCRSPEEWRSTAMSLIREHSDDMNVRALEVALKGALYPGAIQQTLGQRRQRFIHDHDISLSTMIRWERAGAALIAKHWLTHQIEETPVPTDEDIAQYDKTQAELRIAELESEIQALKRMLAERDNLLGKLRQLLNAPDDRD